jgi:hypothetical protein
MARPDRQTPAQMQAACDRFNARYKPGDTITVYTGLIGESPKSAQVRYPAEILSGHTPIVYVTGTYHGSVALTHTAAEVVHG